jgi:hypothetical protein
LVPDGFDPIAEVPQFAHSITSSARPSKDGGRGQAMLGRQRNDEIAMGDGCGIRQHDHAAARAAVAPPRSVTKSRRPMPIAICPVPIGIMPGAMWGRISRLKSAFCPRLTAVQRQKCSKIFLRCKMSKMADFVVKVGS